MFCKVGEDIMNKTYMTKLVVISFLINILFFCNIFASEKEENIQNRRKLTFIENTKDLCPSHVPFDYTEFYDEELSNNEGALSMILCKSLDDNWINEEEEIDTIFADEDFAATEK